MTAKNYAVASRILTVLLGAAVAVAVSVGGYMISLILIAVGVAAAASLKARVKDVLSDERDAAIAGRASIIAAAAFSWLAVIVSMVLYSLQDLDPRFETAAAVLSFSALALMLLQGAASRLAREKVSPKAWVAALLVSVVLAVAAVAAVRFSLVGYWSCEDGQWVKHNNPEVPAPDMACPRRS